MPAIVAAEDAGRAGLWGRWERAFTAEGPADGQRLELLVELTAPGGQRRTVRGFWDGGDGWRVRFMPTEPGRWTWRTSSRPAVAGLDGRSGTFECVESAGGTRFLQHGPVQVSRTGTHLEHADGTPFFWLVDTAWNGALLSRRDDWDAFLRDRAAKRFTGVKFVMTQWRTAFTNAEGQVAYTGFDDIRIEPAFFRRLDDRIDAVNARGLLAVPVLLWTLGEAEENPGQLPESEAIRLARYMVARYQAHHVMYFLPGDGNFSGEQAARWQRIGGAVFDLAGHAPAMLHPRGMHWPYEEWRDVEWLSVHAYQSGHGDDGGTLRWIHSGPPAAGWREEPVRPVINVEPPYEDHVAYQSRQRHTAYTVRRAVYWSLLNAPTAGVSYGAHGVWSWQEEPGVPLNHEGTGEAKTWRDAMALPGSTDMKHMAGLFTSLPWWTLQPDASLVEAPDHGELSAEEAAARHVAAARTPAGDAAVIYLPLGGDVRVRRSSLAAGAEARWFDPRDGSIMPAEPNGGTYHAPDAGQDWVLWFGAPTQAEGRAVAEFISRDGTRIGCSIGGSGAPLVLIHGTSADHSRWLPVREALERRFTVYAMDRRGRGASGDAAAYAIEREFEDVAAVVDGIGEPVNLVAHSFGALAALEAARQTDNVRKLVLYEPPLPLGGQEIYPPGIIDRLQARLDAGDREGVVVTFLAEVPRVPQAQLELMRSLPAWQARVAAAHTVVRELRVHERYVFRPEVFGDVEVPTLLLLGGDSPPFFHAAMQAADAALPRSRVAVMPGQQHAAMDTGPDIFLREVLAFLDE